MQFSVNVPVTHVSVIFFCVTQAGWKWCLKHIFVEYIFTTSCKIRDEEYWKNWCSKQGLFVSRSDYLNINYLKYTINNLYKLFIIYY